MIENLFLPLVIILDHHQGQLLLLEVQLGDLGPEEEPYKQRNSEQGQRYFMKVKVKDSMRVDESESVSSPIFVSPSKTKMPVGVRPKLQDIVVIFTIVFTSIEIPNILYNTCIPIHLCQALYAYPLRTSPDSWPCSRTRAPPVPGSDPWQSTFR